LLGIVPYFGIFWCRDIFATLVQMASLIFATSRDWQ